MLVRLPVSHKAVVLREAGGREDMLLAEAKEYGVELAVRLLRGLAIEADGSQLVIEALPLTDLEVSLLRLRQHTIGDVIRSDATCQREGCQEHVEIGFRVAEYLEHHAPQEVSGVASHSEAPWWSFADGRIVFRAPTVEDHLAAADTPPGGDRAEALWRRCVRETELSAADRARVEEALDRMAPSLLAELQGTCPKCQETVRATFDPVSYVLRELSRKASSVFGEIHLLAAYYHWSEREILDLPSHRRGRYAELVRTAGGAG